MSTTEIFNLNQVKTIMTDIEQEFSDLATLINDTNTAITTALGSPDKALYGDAGNKILATWDENCSTLNSFMSIFDSWSMMVTSIATEFAELDKGTAEVKGLDVEALKTLSNANRTTMLKTSVGSSYSGSNSSFVNPETGNSIEESSNLNDRRTVEYTDENGNKIIEYYSLSGVLLGTEKNGKYYDANNRQVDQIGTKEELERAEKVKSAQAQLKESVKVKHEERAQRDKERAERPKYNNPGGLTGGHLSFLESIIDGAIKTYKKYGVLPSLTLAQAILESGWGESKLASEHNNLFGIKAGSSWTGRTVNYQTGEQNPDGSRYSVRDDFRSYDSVEESIEDHAKLLSTDNYRAVIAATNAEEACRAVKAAGYATSVDYAKNLMNLINKYGLDQWDPK